MQAKDGYLWIATIGGVSKFDGKNFTNYNKSNGLLNNVITAIHETGTGEILIACQGGMVLIDGNQLFQYPFPDTLNNVIIFDIEELNGDVYLTTNGFGVFRWNHEITEIIRFEDENQNFIRTAEKIDQSLLLGSKAGIHEFNGRSAREIISNISVNKIATSENSWWIATTKHGIINISKTDTIYIDQEFGIPSLYQKDIAIDNNGNPWFISKNSIVEFDIERNELVSIRSTYPQFTENLKVIYFDGDGNMWIGTSGSGILKFTGIQTETYTLDDGLPSNQIMNIVEDNEGSLWFATYGDGVIKYDGQRFAAFDFDDGLRNNTVWTIESIGSEIWVGSSDGINIIQSGNIRDFGFNDSLPFARVSSIYFDSDSNVWIGTRDGLIRYKSGEINTPPEIKALNLLEVKSFCQIGSTIWISSRDGAFGYNQESREMTILNRSNGLIEDYVSTLSNDRYRNLWLGTDDGIYCYNNKTKQISHVDVSDAPSANIVTFVMHDSTDNLWIGTDNGLFSLNTKLFYEKDSVHIKSYNEHDGITSLECNQNAAYCDSQGKLWLGLNGTLVSVKKSANYSLKTTEYGSVLKEVQVNFDVIEPKSYIPVDDSIPVFSYSSNRFTFKYASVQFTNPDKVLFSYRLLGSDDRWSPEVSENAVTYANLSPGDYTFEVRTRLENEPWGIPSKLLSFRIAPPFYLTWWFILLATSILILLVYGINALLKRENNRKKALSEIQNRAKILGLEQENLNAHMNRHFIFNALNSIQYYINTQEKRLANNYLTKFAALVRKNLDSAQSESISLHDELERLKLYLNLEQMRFKNRFDFTIETLNIPDSELLFVPSMILQPFVENSIMHGILPSEKFGQIEIKISLEDNSIQLEIKDNGIGINTSIQRKKGTTYHVSNGMKITRQRLDVLKNISGKNYSVLGPEEIKDSDGNVVGTRVFIILPINTKKNLY